MCVCVTIRKSNAPKWSHRPNRNIAFQSTDSNFSRYIHICYVELRKLCWGAKLSKFAAISKLKNIKSTESFLALG